MTLAHDAVMRITPADLSMLEEVDDIVSEAMKNKDPEIAWAHAQDLRRGRQVRGWALAMLLSEMKAVWAVFESDDPFDEVASQRTGYSKTTINKYVKTWDRVIKQPKVLTDDVVTPYTHPEDGAMKLLGHPVDTVYRLASASIEGELTKEDWEEAYMAPDKESMMDIRQRVRGEQTSSGSRLKIMLERDGTIKARRGGAYEIGGQLLLDKRDDSEVIDAMCERIIKSSGIFIRGEK
jgi:hypothetical protein